LIDPTALNDRVDLVLGAVAHREYKGWTAEQVRELLRDGGQIADLRRLWNWSGESTGDVWTL
jgi:hypothetical protein